MSDAAGAAPEVEAGEVAGKTGAPGVGVGSRGRRPGGPQRIPRPAVVRAGPEPWWAAAPPATMSLRQVRDAFSGSAADRPTGRDRGARRQPADVLPFADRRPAAVLCALWEDNGQATVLLTRRSARLRSHTGEVSFPGGRIDPGESAMDAAIREAHEEVDLDPEKVEIIGRLHSLATVSSRAAITPFIGVLAERPVLRPNPTEVARAFGVALVDLMAPGCYHEERWDTGDGVERPIHFFDLPGDTVWGATARMLVDLIDLVGAPVRPS